MTYENDAEEILNEMIEVELNTPSTFLAVKETLTRMGVVSIKEKTLYPSCLVLHKRGKYYISHFKSLFAIDGGESSANEEDFSRLNTVASLLRTWGLVSFDDSKLKPYPIAPHKIGIISFKDKENWTIKHKFRLGKLA